MNEEEKTAKEEWMDSAQKFFQRGDFSGMRACAQEILAHNLDDVDGLTLLGQASLYLGEAEKAETVVRRVECSAPLDWRLLLLKGELARARHQLEAAVEVLVKLWGMGQRAEGELPSDRLAVLERGGRLLADTYVLLAEPERASELLFELSALVQGTEEKADLYSKGLFLSNYTKHSVQQSLARHERYNAFFGAKVTMPRRPLTDPARRGKLRIGYISADFREHSMANLLTPFLRDYTKLDFNIYVYMAGEADKVTKRFRRFAAVWRDVCGMPAQETARLIYQDRIDILVDFSGHSQHSCLPVLAYKPAPVQLSGLGYVNTTGLREVDYFLSDAVCLPEREQVRGFSERIVRLPQQLCYVPETVKELPPAVTVPPCLRRGYVTFGSFNDFAKVSHETLLLWRGVLEAVPDSRLLLKGRVASLMDGRRAALAKLSSVGIDTERVSLVPFSEDYLREYGEVDIALDTTPYNGGITTCEALLMGVPVITLRGDTHGSRFAASVLEAACLPELIASSGIDYVKKAVQLANAPELLRRFHEGLREAVTASPLMDGAGYMREVEAMYRRLWEEHQRENVTL